MFEIDQVVVSNNDESVADRFRNLTFIVTSFEKCPAKTCPPGVNSSECPKKYAILHPMSKMLEIYGIHMDEWKRDTVRVMACVHALHPLET